MDDRKELWESVKDSLHISHTKSDAEIRQKVNACLLDLKRVGVDTVSEDDTIGILCELYAKWHFNFNGSAESFRQNYQEMRDAVSLSEEYRLTDRKEMCDESAE